MIISASRRTDLPAFYGEWFMNRIREGYLYVQNPFNARQFTRVDLECADVDVIVFWTKNPAPMMHYLDELDERGYRYYFQFTLTAYPPVLEPHVPRREALLSTFRELSGRIGPDRVVWRFDPVILSDATDENTILETFAFLAGQIGGCTRRVVISFMHYYGSVVRNLRMVEKTSHVRFYDITDDHERMRRIAGAMAEIAESHGIEIVSCAGKLDLSRQGVKHGKCIDDVLIHRVFGITVSPVKDPYQRAECQCVRSKDVGQYNSCTHDCVYCYANSNRRQAHARRAAHDPGSPFLTGGASGADVSGKEAPRADLFGSAHETGDGEGK